jgi:hypothetical protein
MFATAGYWLFRGIDDNLFGQQIPLESWLTRLLRFWLTLHGTRSEHAQHEPPMTRFGRFKIRQQLRSLDGIGNVGLVKGSQVLMLRGG